MPFDGLQFAIAANAIKILPKLDAWAFIASGLRPHEVVPPCREDVPTDIVADAVAIHPRIVVWRNAFRAMGLKPSEQRSSVEQLVRRAIGGHRLATGIWTVDLYNTVSLRHLAPIGGYDVARLKPFPLVLRTTTPIDHFLPLGGDSAKMKWGNRTVCYAQANEILCWGLNHRDSESTALQQETQTALFVSECVDDDGRKLCLAALADLACHLRKQGAICTEMIRFSQL